MTQPSSTAPLPQHVGVVNVGLPLFADAVASQGAPVISVDWRVPAGGQPALVAALGRLYGQHSERIEASNAEVLRRLDSGVPVLTGIATVGEAAPGLEGRVLLHCGPAVRYAEAPDPLRRSMQAATVAEGWAASPAEADELLGSERIGLSPANAHRVVVPMATALGPGAPLYVVTNEAGGTTAYAPISQGPGEVAWFGCATDASIARLVFLRDVAAPVIAEVLRRSGPVDVLATPGHGQVREPVPDQQVGRGQVADRMGGPGAGLLDRHQHVAQRGHVRRPPGRLAAVVHRRGTRGRSRALSPRPRAGRRRAGHR